MGLGGLGSNACLSLAAAGVGTLRVADFDVVSETDLHRQLLYTEDEVGWAKVDAAQRSVGRVNSHVKVEPRCVRVGVDDGEDLSLAEGCQVILDCTDRFRSRYILNRVASRQKVPVVHGSALEYYGSAASFRPWNGQCIECLYPSMSDDGAPTCAVVGVLPQVVQAVSSLQAAEAINLILGEPRLLNRLIFVDYHAMAFDAVELNPNPRCPKDAGTPLPQESPGPEYTCSRDGRETYGIQLPRRRTADEAWEKANASYEGCIRTSVNAFKFRFGHSDFYYTSSGYLLSMVEPGASGDSATLVKQVALNLGGD